MGAREDLLEAARSLTRRGVEPFSPAELIAEARRHGSTYPNTTLRTHIVGPMCVNSPVNHAVQYQDLHRVGRGLYRLVREEVAPAARVPTAVPPEPPSERRSPTATVDATADWFWEGNVQSAVVRHLTEAGWSTRRVADTASRERGADVEAVRGAERLLAEVKGYPSAAYVRGPKEGMPKAGSAPLQARTYFAGAVLSGLLMRADHPEASIVLAFPRVPTYEALARRTAAPLDAIDVRVWLVAEAGAVDVVDWS